MFYSFVGTHIWPNIQVNKLFIIIFVILNNQDELGCFLGTEEECLWECGKVYGMRNSGTRIVHGIGERGFENDSLKTK